MSDWNPEISNILEKERLGTYIEKLEELQQDLDRPRAVRGWRWVFENGSDRVETRLRLRSVRDRAILMLEQAFSAEHSLARDMERIRFSGSIRTVSVWLWASPHSKIIKMQHILRDAIWTLEHDLFMVGHRRAPLLLSEGEPAQPLSPATREQLLVMVRDLVEEVQHADLSAGDQQQLLAVLQTAFRVLEGDGDPERTRSELERILGYAVARAGRRGSTARLWRRVAECIVIAEAALTLGLGVAAITRPEAARVDVLCNIETPALPPAPTEPTPSHKPRELPSPDSTRQSSAIDE